MAETAYERLRVVLDGREYGNRLTARCPAHEDSSPSLSVRAAGDRALVHCFGGCRTEDVVAALGWTLRDLYDEPRRGRDHVFRINRPRPAPPPSDPSWTYVRELPDDPFGARVLFYTAATVHVAVGSCPGGAVPSW